MDKMTIEQLKSEWENLKTSQKENEGQLQSLSNKNREILTKLEDLSHKAYVSGYIQQYGEWIRKEDVRINPLENLSADEMNKLDFFRDLKNVWYFIKCELSDDFIQNLPVLVQEHYTNYKIARESGNQKMQEILLDELRLIIPKKRYVDFDCYSESDF